MLLHFGFGDSISFCCISSGSYITFLTFTQLKITFFYSNCDVFIFLVVHKPFSWAAMASKNTNSMPPMNQIMTQPPPQTNKGPSPQGFGQRTESKQETSPTAPQPQRQPRWAKLKTCYMHMPILTYLEIPNLN